MDDIQPGLGAVQKEVVAPETGYWDGKTLEDALTTGIKDLRSEAERAELYERLFAVIDRDADWDFPQAHTRLQRALEAEAEEDASDRPPDCITPQARMESILSAVEQRLAARPDLFEQFCSYMPFRWPDLGLVSLREWLNRMAALGEGGPVPSATVLAARIYYGAYGATWQEAGDRLMAAVDHDNLTVRACAAFHIGNGLC